MPVPFDITTLTNSVKLRADHTGEAVFTVFNQSGRALRGRPRLGAVTLQITDASEQAQPVSADAARQWIQVNEADERDFCVADTEECIIPIAVPKGHGLAPGSYQCQFRLDMVGVENPDEDYAEGPTVSFEVAIPEMVIPWWRRYWWALAVGGALLALGVLLGIVLSVRGVEVPNLAGQTLAEANAALTGAGFQVGGSTDEPSEILETGRIIRSNPAAGVKVKRDSSIQLVLSSGPALVALPDVENHLEVNARLLLEEACAPEPCVAVEVAYEKSDEVGAGRVIRSHPIAGTQVQKGSTVSVVVAIGPATVTLPDVEDRLEADAKRLLEGACGPEPCVAVRVSYEQSDEVSTGRVIRCTPGGGTQVQRGSTVSLVVANGPATVVIPNVANLPEANAKSALEQACKPWPCLNVAVVQENSSTVGEGRAVRTDPAVGTRVATGSEVTLVIAHTPATINKTLVADADTYFGDMYLHGRDTDIGHLSDLIIYTDERGSQGVAVLRFDLSGISPQANIEQATLSLYLTKAEGGEFRGDYFAQTLIAEPVIDSWTEDSTEQPGCDPSLQSLAEIGSVGRYQDWDVTEIVRQQVSGGRKNLGICLVVPEEEAVEWGQAIVSLFTSREGSRGQQPLLSLTYRQ